ncbi:MAG: hypothetical protein NT129_02140 [Candidatus Aenigmarchaeota archaeon]|nr:hypothetical protein [Candidatus Aenigmarchaeota archaeon]
MSKAQVVSGDFTISVAIFIAILIMVLPLWGYVENQVRSSEERIDLESSLLIASDVLTKTKGLPENWSASNVRSIGLVDEEGILNITKVLNLINMSYDSVRDLLGVSNYNLYISLKDIDGYDATSGVCNSPAAYFSVNEEDMKNIIANSGIIWDYYYGGSGTPERRDSRSLYNASKTDAFNAMLSNSSSYKTIIIENPELQESDININELKTFLNLGGILVFEGNATLIKDSFGMHAEQGLNREGVVTEKNRFVAAEVGDNVTFNNAGWAFYQGNITLHKLITDKNDNNGAVVGYWDYGLGKIYYISDNSGIIDSNALELNIVGEKLEFGVQANGTLATKVQRLVLLAKERNIVINMGMVLWK